MRDARQSTRTSYTRTTGRRVYDETHFTNLDGMRFTWAYCIGKTKAERLAWEVQHDCITRMRSWIIEEGYATAEELDELEEESHE